MVKVRSIIILPLLAFTLQVNAQELITGAMNNPALSSPDSKQKKSRLKSSTPLTIPFYDDFSSGKSTPDANHWADRYVFINNTFSTDQLTQGVATFDALDQNGNLYSNASANTFAADTLTSLPIDLAYNPSDSVYLSFLYEAGGIADPPETNDSLTLEFFAPSEASWHSIWRAKGGGSEKFKRVMIGIVDTKFLQSGFRFRFTNYASLSGIVSEPSKAGNADEWNLDCVILNSGRTVNDTVMHDVAFTLPQRSLLNNLEAMPWTQFKKAYLVTMGSIATLNYRNNDDTIRNITRNIYITDVYKNLIVREIGPAANQLQPLTDNTFEEELLYTYGSTTADSALFHIQYSLKHTLTNDPKENDTLNYFQIFSNYFAYDDGTKEAGYGINGEGAENAMVALRYRSYMADSVAAISICFNDAYNNANRIYFYPEVWSDNDGQPGEIIGTGEEALAEPTTTHNGFMTYKFSKPIAVSGYFWIGWKQVGNSYLNAGLDLNTPPLNRQYYWINGSWYVSSAPGTILLRAVMTGDGTSTSTDDGKVSATTHFLLFPNPSSGYINISCPGSNTENYKLAICNLSGSVIIVSDVLTDVDISNLDPGYYFAVVKASGKPVAILKFIKVN